MDEEIAQEFNSVRDAIAILKDGIRQLDESREVLRRTSPPVGCIPLFAVETEPPGYLFCDGQAISRIDFAELLSQRWV